VSLTPALADRLASVQPVADAVMFEGYLLYPYRASAQKNQLRWQFGVLMPPGYAAAAGEPDRAQTECLLEPRGATRLAVRLRFLHVQARRVEQAVGRGRFRPVASLPVDGVTRLPFDEGRLTECDTEVELSRLLREPVTVPLHVPSGRDVEPLVDAAGAVVGRYVRARRPLATRLELRAEELPGPYGAVRLRVTVGNDTAWDTRDGGRDGALRRALVATHTVLAVAAGGFLSMVDPPEWARPAVRACRNEHTWPVLAGPPGSRDTLLSAPIILADHPGIAPESPGELYDGTEIDEILTLRTLALTEEEKREARATDPRAAAVVDRVDTMPPAVLERLHGAIRSIRAVTPPPAPATPWWDPGADGSVSPETDTVPVAGVPVGRGSRVTLRPGRPGSRRADAQDLFLSGRPATVQAVLLDVDGDTHLAVTLDDDPGADLAGAIGRFRYFHPDEVEPLP
jgi:hypothetical protein